MELLLICGLIILTFINIAWFVLLKETVKIMESMNKVIEANAELSHTMATEMIKDKMKENKRLKESIKDGE